MKYLVFALVFMLLSVSIISQEKFYNPVIVYPISKNTNVKLNGKSIQLDSILICHYDDQMEVITGKAGILDRGETELSSGEKLIVIRVTANKVASNPSVVDKLSRFMNEPSVYLPNLYSNERNYFVVFPLESKVYNPESIKLFMSKKNKLGSKLFLYSYYTDSLLYETESPFSEFLLNDVLKHESEKFYWKLYLGDIPIKGRFELLSELQKQNLNLPDLVCKWDYLNAYFIFLENDCKFDALAVLEQAIKRFKGCELFTTIAANLPLYFEY